MFIRHALQRPNKVTLSREQEGAFQQHTYIRGNLMQTELGACAHWTIGPEWSRTPSINTVHLIEARISDISRAELNSHKAI